MDRKSWTLPNSLSFAFADSWSSVAPQYRFSKGIAARALTYVAFTVVDLLLVRAEPWVCGKMGWTTPKSITRRWASRSSWYLRWIVGFRRINAPDVDLTPRQIHTRLFSTIRNFVVEILVMQRKSDGAFPWAYLPDLLKKRLLLSRSIV
jgi:hypothetical protein